ncbi:MAG TPA: hypothetical protein VG425_08110 [Casimicrobiaceae bacterium]|nr:hypothetical protein [Casimicrobiaceae bacterium]
MINAILRTMPQGVKYVNRAAASPPFCSVIFRVTLLAPDGSSRLRGATT